MNDSDLKVAVARVSASKHKTMKAHRDRKILQVHTRTWKQNIILKEQNGSLKTVAETNRQEDGNHLHSKCAAGRAEVIC